MFPFFNSQQGMQQNSMQVQPNMGMPQNSMQAQPNTGMRQNSIQVQPNMGMPQSSMQVQPSMGMQQNSMQIQPNMGMPQNSMQVQHNMGMPNMGMPQNSMQVLQPNMGMPQNSMQVQPNMGMPQNSMQVQPNMGMVNPRVPNPFNTQMNNGPSMGVQHQPGQNFATCPNNMMNFPNNQLGVPQFGPFGSATLPIGNMGFPPQNNVNQGNLLANMHQQQLNGNLGFPNGQFLAQNLVPMLMSGSGQVGGFGVNPGFNQLGLGVVNQNPGVFGYPRFGILQPNQQGMVMPGMGGNMMNPSGIAGQLPQGNWPAPANSGSVGPQQSQNLQSPNSVTAQGNNVKSQGNNTVNSSWKKFPARDFKRNTNGEASHEGFKKPQLHAKNAKRKFGSFNENNQKGLGRGKAGKFGLANSTNQAPEQKRPVIYTEQEIQKWREQRKRNYPSKSNLEKKLAQKLKDSKITETEASLRREQLKEILAKQAELGVEVAEIPSHYLSNSDRRVHETNKNIQQLTKKGKFQNKFDKRGRHNKRGPRPKRKNFENDDSSISSMNKRKPSLLEKLLSADIKRDKSNLLQVFRFMVMNSCFKDWPEKPLKYPEVIVRENRLEGDNANEQKLTVPGDISEANIKSINQNTVEHGNNSNDYDGSSSNNESDGEEAEDHLKEPSSEGVLAREEKLTVPGERSESNVKSIDQNTVEHGDSSNDHDSSSSNNENDGEEAEGHLKEPSSDLCRIGVGKETKTPKEEEGEIID